MASGSWIETEFEERRGLLNDLWRVWLILAQPGIGVSLPYVLFKLRYMLFCLAQLSNRRGWRALSRNLWRLLVTVASAPVVFILDGVYLLVDLVYICILPLFEETKLYRWIRRTLLRVGTLAAITLYTVLALLNIFSMTTIIRNVLWRDVHWDDEPDTWDDDQVFGIHTPDEDVSMFDEEDDFMASHFSDHMFHGDAQEFDGDAQEFDEDTQMFDEDAPEFDEDTQMFDEDAQEFDESTQMPSEDGQYALSETNSEIERKTFRPPDRDKPSIDPSKPQVEPTSHPDPLLPETLQQNRAKHEAKAFEPFFRPSKESEVLTTAAEESRVEPESAAPPKNPATTAKDASRNIIKDEPVPASKAQSTPSQSPTRDKHDEAVTPPMIGSNSRVNHPEAYMSPERFVSSPTKMASIALLRKKGFMEYSAEQSLEDLTEKTLETPAEQPLGDALAKKPVEAPAEKPVKAPAEKPVEAPAEKPVKAPAKEPIKALAEKPVKALAKEPIKAPAEKPVEALEALAEEPVRAPAEKPVKALAKEPIKAPAKEPVKAPAEEPVRAPAEVAHETLFRPAPEISAEKAAPVPISEPRSATPAPQAIVPIEDRTSPKGKGVAETGLDSESKQIREAPKRVRFALPTEISFVDDPVGQGESPEIPLEEQAEEPAEVSRDVPGPVSSLLHSPADTNPSESPRNDPDTVMEDSILLLKYSERHTSATDFSPAPSLQGQTFQPPPLFYPNFFTGASASTAPSSNPLTDPLGGQSPVRGRPTDVQAQPSPTAPQSPTKSAVRLSPRKSRFSIDIGPRSPRNRLRNLTGSSSSPSRRNSVKESATPPTEAAAQVQKSPGEPKSETENADSKMQIDTEDTSVQAPSERVDDPMDMVESEDTEMTAVVGESLEEVSDPSGASSSGQMTWSPTKKAASSSGQMTWSPTKKTKSLEDPASSSQEPSMASSSGIQMAWVPTKEIKPLKDLASSSQEQSMASSSEKMAWCPDNKTESLKNPASSSQEQSMASSSERMAWCPDKKPESRKDPASSTQQPSTQTPRADVDMPIPDAAPSPYEVRQSGNPAGTESRPEAQQPSLPQLQSSTQTSQILTDKNRLQAPIPSNEDKKKHEQGEAMDVLEDREKTDDGLAEKPQEAAVLIKEPGQQQSPAVTPRVSLRPPGNYSGLHSMVTKTYSTFDNRSNASFSFSSPVAPSFRGQMGEEERHGESQVMSPDTHHNRPELPGRASKGPDSPFSPRFSATRASESSEPPTPSAARPIKPTRERKGQMSIRDPEEGTGLRGDDQQSGGSQGLSHQVQSAEKSSQGVEHSTSVSREAPGHDNRPEEPLPSPRGFPASPAPEPKEKRRIAPKKKPSLFRPREMSRPKPEKKNSDSPGVSGPSQSPVPSTTGPSPDLKSPGGQRSPGSGLLGGPSKPMTIISSKAGLDIIRRQEEERKRAQEEEEQRRLNNQ